MVKKKKKSTALAKTGNSDLALPDYIKTGAGRGMENVDQTDILLPRVKLLQQMSPEVQDGDMKAGQLVNSISGQLIGDGEEVEFIAVAHFKSRILFEGIGAEAKIICSSPNGLKNMEGINCLTCEKSQWPDEKEAENRRKNGLRLGPECVQFYNFPVLLLTGNGQPEIAGLSMSRTKIKVAKKLLTLVRHAGAGIDIFGLKFKLTTVKESSANRTYHNFDITRVGYPSKKEYEFAEKFYEAVSKADKVTVHDQTGEEEPDDNGIPSTKKKKGKGKF